MIALGFVLVVLGMVIPFLMVLRVIQPSLLLSFLSHGISVGGMFLGVMGSAMYVRARKH